MESCVIDVDNADYIKTSFELIVGAPETGPSHISLYVAILHFASCQSYNNPVTVFSRDLMKRAKIAGFATYHKCMRDLKAIGLINYVPSCNPFLGSLIYLLK